MFRKALKYILKSALIGFAAVILAAVGIDAFDNNWRLHNTFAGRLIFGEKDLCPAGMAYVGSESGGFCIDIYEASTGGRCLYDDPESITQTKANIDNPFCAPLSVSQAKPWRFISRSQAAEACAKAGKRLPSAKEWQMAALGTPDKDAGWNESDCHTAANWESQPGLTGAGRACKSSAGAYDMIGNVWEWIDESASQGKFMERDLPAQGYVADADIDGIAFKTDGQGSEIYNHDYFWIKTNEIKAVARGGYWNNKELAGKYSAYIVVSPSAAEAGIGFRCAK